jgi:hypothetical protein
VVLAGDAAIQKLQKYRGVIAHPGIRWVEAIPLKGRRAKRIRLSQRGWRCVQLGRRARTRISKLLIRAGGQKNYENAKSTLLTCLRALGGIERIRSRRNRPPG